MNPKALYMERDHQAHVSEYWREQFRKAGAHHKPVPIPPVDYLGRRRPSSYNPAPFRYPSIQEDPTDYQSTS